MAMRNPNSVSMSVANIYFPIPTTTLQSSDAGHAFQSPPSSSLKTSFLVHTESNVRKWVKKKPNPHCVVCDGSGKVCCRHCQGKGRTNHTNLMMLPSGKWPKWCRTCGGSGLSYCDRCLGTGEYREVLGFHFLKQSNSMQDSGDRTFRIQEDENLGAADFLLSGPVNPPDESSYKDYGDKLDSEAD